jgi:branched-chain amino acid transport system ATP-binding protein
VSVVINDALVLRDVGRQFGGVRAVGSVSFNVKRGERRAVLGSNGAGKTTLFNIIAGDIRPTSGAVAFFGQDITRLPPHRRARLGLSRTYQAAHCFGGLSVRANLFLAVRGAQPGRMSLRLPSPTSEAHEFVARLAADVGLAPVLDSLVAALSHGEQRQLELGMALAGKPRLIILDEPAAGLSPGERARLTDLLLLLDAATTLLIIEHDMDVALRVADVVTVMHDGSVVATGSPDEIRTSAIVHNLYLGSVVA